MTVFGFCLICGDPLWHNASGFGVCTIVFKIFWFAGAGILFADSDAWRGIGFIGSSSSVRVL